MQVIVLMTIISTSFASTPSHKNSYCYWAIGEIGIGFPNYRVSASLLKVVVFPSWSHGIGVGTSIVESTKGRTSELVPGIFIPLYIYFVPYTKWEELPAVRPDKKLSSPVIKPAFISNLTLYSYFSFNSWIAYAIPQQQEPFANIHYPAHYYKIGMGVAHSLSVMSITIGIEASFHHFDVIESNMSNSSFCIGLIGSLGGWYQYR